MRGSGLPMASSPSASTTAVTPEPQVVMTGLSRSTPAFSNACLIRAGGARRPFSMVVKDEVFGSVWMTVLSSEALLFTISTAFILLAMVLEDYFSKLSPAFWQFGIGLLLVLVVLFARRGVLGLFESFGEYLAERKK